MKNLIGMTEEEMALAEAEYWAQVADTDRTEMEAESRAAIREASEN